MANNQQICFQAAALVLSYPDETLLERLDLIEASLADTPSAPYFTATIGHLRSMPLEQLQSFHVQEFDLSRRHALHLSYWTDGDTRRRGEVLGQFKRVYRDSGLLVDLDGELPDYLPMVLEFAARGDLDRGLVLLNGYRASLELLRLGLAGDRLPQAGVVEAVCRQLAGPMATSRSEVQRLYGVNDAPPTETVGLEPYQIHTGRPL